MPYYATTNDVLNVCTTSKVAEEVGPFLDAAHERISQLPTDHGYSSGELRWITANLAGHFIQLQDPVLMEHKVDDVTKKAQAKVGDGFAQTPCGRALMALDRKGLLGDGTEKGRTMWIRTFGPSLPT